MVIVAMTAMMWNNHTKQTMFKMTMSMMMMIWVHSIKSRSASDPRYRQHCPPIQISCKLNKTVPISRGPTVWAQPPQTTILAHVGQFLPQARCHQACESMASFSPLTCAPEHDVLAARIDVNIILADGHTPCMLWAQPPQIPILAPVVQFLPQTSWRQVWKRDGDLSHITRVPNIMPWSPAPT